MRGEASLRLSGKDLTLRPTFDALVQAEQELGSLLALVDRAAENRLTLAEIAALFWFCLPDRTAFEREQVGGHALAGTVTDYELSFEDGERMQGRFLVQRLDYSGDFNGERNYSLQLESSGPVAAL